MSRSFSIEELTGVLNVRVRRLVLLDLRNGRRATWALPIPFLRMKIGRRGKQWDDDRSPWQFQPPWTPPRPSSAMFHLPALLLCASAAANGTHRDYYCCWWWCYWSWGRYLMTLLIAEVIYSVRDSWMSVQHWWNDSDRGKQKYSEKRSCAILPIIRVLAWCRYSTSILCRRAVNSTPEQQGDMPP